MRIKNIFRRKKYAKGGVGPKKPPEYIEKDTKCDLCSNLGDCIDDGIVINVRTMMDIKDHYAIGLACEFPKDPAVKLKNSYCKCKEAMNNCLGKEDMMTVAEWNRKANEFQDAFKEMINVLDELFGGSEK